MQELIAKHSDPPSVTNIPGLNVRKRKAINTIDDLFPGSSSQQLQITRFETTPAPERTPDSRFSPILQVLPIYEATDSQSVTSLQILFSH